MDSSIISYDAMPDRGAQAFDSGIGVDDHGLEPGSRAAKLWEFGWHGRRVEYSRERGNRPTSRMSLQLKGNR